MRLLDRHLLREVVGPFLFGVAAFTSIMFAGKYLLDLTEYVLKGMPVLVAVELLILSLPSVIVLTLPMSALLAVLLGFGRLSGDSEVVALFAGGISIYRCAVPIAVMGVVISIAGFVINEVIVPESTLLAREIPAKVLGEVKTPRSFSYVDVNGDVTNQIWVQGGIDAKKKVMRDVSVTQLRKGKPSLFFWAAEARYEGGDRWRLEDGYFRNLDPNHRSGGKGSSQIPDWGTFTGLQTTVIHVNKNPKQVKLAAMKPEEMSLGQLAEHIRAMKAARAEGTAKLEVGYWQKFALPLASLVFALLGAPLGIRPHRTSSSMGLGLSILIILIFWMIWHYMTALSMSGGISPAVGAFTADAVGVAAACLLLVKAAK